MEVDFYQAECGDAARIRYRGTDQKFHNIFVDSGYSKTFRFILEEIIQDIIDNNEKIDLWVISHIHDDHIGGVIKYIETIKNGEYKDLVEKFYYNPPRNYESKKETHLISEARSIDQGDILYDYLKNKGKLIDFDITNSNSTIDIYGLKLTILSPSEIKLKKLKKKYSTGIPLEREELETISEALTRGNNDYSMKLVDFNLQSWKEDKSVENGSSISFLAEFERSISLWLADSHPSDIILSLNRLGYDENNKLNCELVKISHHGSKGNNYHKLFDIINCEKYIFSVNGENNYNLPSKECIAHLLRHEQRELYKKYLLFFTYDNQTLKSIFKDEESNIYSKYNFQTIFSSKKILKLKIEK